MRVKMSKEAYFWFKQLPTPVKQGSCMVYYLV